MNPFAVLPPELYLLVAQHLDYKTIVACSLVNRSWHQQFCPSVWETVTIKTPIQYEAFRASVDSGALSRHGRLIRTLKTEYYGVIEMLVANGSTTCTNLTLLDVTLQHLRKGSADGPISMGAKPWVCLFENNPGLKSVTLHGRPLTMGVPMSQILSALPVSVEYLRLDGYAGWPREDEDQELIGVHEQDHASIIRATDDGLKDDLPRLELRKIELAGEVQGINCVFETLRRSPLLEHLAFDDALYYDFVEEGLSDVLHDHCPVLTSLYFNPGFVDDGRMAQLVNEASSKGWKHLTITGEGFGPDTEAAILKHAGSLESIRLDIELGFPSSAIQRLFCSAPNLKSFRGGWPCFVYENVQLDVMDMIQSPWVCHSLEQLQLCISGVPRPDLTKRTNGRPLTGPLHEGSSMESSYTVQRQAYAQLAKLTKLRELVLSVSLERMRLQSPEDLSEYECDTEGTYYDSRYPQAERQYECLSFTLESGLDLLRDLKELRVIDLNDMAVGFDGEAEQRWMKEHWPLVRQTWAYFICYPMPETEKKSV
ncbi:hypothetical protein BGZ75_000280 [Mortierella antarctica]|nr:hypothetical protein BGZ75_000280 [Mortierella antarctica]